MAYSWTVGVPLVTLSAPIFRVTPIRLLPEHSSIVMNMEATRFSETSFTSYEPDRCQQPKDYYVIVGDEYAVEPRYNEVGFIGHLAYSVRCSVVPINSSQLAITLHSSVITTRVYKDTLYNDTNYSVPFMTLWPNSTVRILCNLHVVALFFDSFDRKIQKFQIPSRKMFWVLSHFPFTSSTLNSFVHHNISFTGFKRRISITGKSGLYAGCFRIHGFYFR